MSSSLDDVIQRQVEQFNQHVEDAASFQKHILKRMCAERIRQDFKEVHNPTVRIRTVRPSRPAGIVGFTLQQVGRIGEAGKHLARRVFCIRQEPAESEMAQPGIIEGAYTVINDESEELSTTNKEEK